MDEEHLFIQAILHIVCFDKWSTLQFLFPRQCHIHSITRQGANVSPYLSIYIPVNDVINFIGEYLQWNKSLTAHHSVPLQFMALPHQRPASPCRQTRL